MNPIENLWDLLKKEMHLVPITTKTAPIERLVYVWFHSEKIKDHCKNMLKAHCTQIHR